MSSILKKITLLFFAVIVISCLKGITQPSGKVNIKETKEIPISGGNLPSRIKNHILLDKGQVLLIDENKNKYLLEYSGNSIVIDSKQDSPKLINALTRSKTFGNKVIKNPKLDKRNYESYRDQKSVIYTINTPRKISGGIEDSRYPKTFVYIHSPHGQAPQIGTIPLHNIQSLINRGYIFFTHFHNLFHPKSKSKSKPKSKSKSKSKSEIKDDDNDIGIGYLGENPTPEVKSGVMTKTEFKNLIASGPDSIIPVQVTGKVKSSIAFPISESEIVICLHLDGHNTYTRGLVYKAEASSSHIPSKPLKVSEDDSSDSTKKN